MNRFSIIPLSVAALSLTLLIPASAQPINKSESRNGSITASHASKRNTPLLGQREAMRMVRAQARLDHPLNADKIKTGAQFRATLNQKVQLKNGPELPSGTVLMGKVVQDQMNQAGTSKLALRFTQADLKDGQVVPIKAMIVGIYNMQNMNSGYPGSAVVPNSWSHTTLRVDQIGAMSGVDLHSNVASRNSGVLVSTKKHNMKLSSGTEFALAITEQGRTPLNKNSSQGQQ